MFFQQLAKIPGGRGRAAAVCELFRRHKDNFRNEKERKAVLVRLNPSDAVALRNAKLISEADLKWVKRNKPCWKRKN